MAASFKHWGGREYARAVVGDEAFGHICPACAGPKTLQAFLCRPCRADAQCTHGNERRGRLRGYTGARVVNYHGPGT